MFIDEAEIEVKAGKGGKGSASFRREKYVPKGGPDGGDGGDGGDVYLVIKENIHGLASLIATRHYRAESGEPGRSKKQHGKDGKDITIAVPPGTVVYEVVSNQKSKVKSQKSTLDETDTQPQPIIDTATLVPGETYRIAKGGKGGLGNVHFATSTNQTPRESTPGAPGEHKRLRLIVQHLADVGLVGLPNVGKSTFLARVSDARPKIANYPFTTLEPHLGVVQHREARLVVADIPGLIEGAAAGKGLGHAFLRHLGRTRVLLHLIDAQSEHPRADYETVRAELGAFDPSLLDRPVVVAVSRVDTLSERDQRRLWTAVRDLEPTFLSAATGRGVTDVLDKLVTMLRGVDSLGDNVVG